MSYSWLTPAGVVGTYTEGDNISLSLLHDASDGDVVLLSGSLPDGLDLDNIGNITGQIGLVSEPTIYTFTLRLRGNALVVDRTFSIVVTNTTPIWITPTNIVSDNGPYRQQQTIDFQIEAYEPSNSPIIYTMISGRLPDGVYFREDGKLVGFISDNYGPYYFTVEANTTPKITKSFVLEVLDTSENRPPFWSTLQGWLGDVYDMNFFTFNLTSGDADSDTLTYTLVSGSLPDGLTLDSSGLISGIPNTNRVETFNFDISVSDGTISETRSFFIRSNFSNQYNQITIIPTPGLVVNGTVLSGTLMQDDDSYFELDGTSEGEWVRYQYISGNLPIGLRVDLATGEIQGTVNMANSPGEYEFIVKLYDNSTAETDVTVIITIVENTVYRSYGVSSAVLGKDRATLNQIYNGYAIPFNRIYRPSDKNFGITLSNIIPIMKYTDLEVEALKSLVQDKLSSYANPFKFKVVPITSLLGEYICDCVVLTFMDSDMGSLEYPVQNETGRIIPVTNFEIFRKNIETNSSNVINFSKWQNEFFTTNTKNSTFTINNHNIYTGKSVYFNNQILPAPLLNEVEYFAIKINDTTIRLAASYTDATNGNFIILNPNEPSYNGNIQSYTPSIPIVYVIKGQGDAIVNLLTTNYMSSIKNVIASLSFFIHKDNGSGDLNMIYFEENSYLR